jgi:2-isopropylmalate synthase
MKPFFYDVTLRDGNQALRKSWDFSEKEIIFKQLVKLGVQGIEVGFASASDKDFKACEHLAKQAPSHIVISSLSRAVKREIELSYLAIKHAPKHRVHIVFPVSDFAIENILKISRRQVIQIVLDSVSYARKLVGKKGEVQFSGEHFGDCLHSVEFALEVFRTAVDSGADIINLPNTVERTRPKFFWDMAKEVIQKIQRETTFSVHTHNDLGMATAVTVESFFLGIKQLETSLNGLGERAGNTNIYEVAVALLNSGVEVDLNFSEIQNTANLISRMSNIPIHEKAPLIGSDVFAHRSGIHQDGVLKTQHLKKSAYGAIDPVLIGRNTGHSIEITSQSGSGAIKSILEKQGIFLEDEDLYRLQKDTKNYSDLIQKELNEEEMICFYREWSKQLVEK